MDKPLIRVAWQDDKPAIADLNTRAFEQEDEARIITQLEKDGDVVLQLVAELDGRLVGHILFFAIGVRGKLGAVGLGPMSVDPWVQRLKMLSRLTASPRRPPDRGVDRGRVPQ